MDINLEIKRISFEDNREKNSIRMDRNEKVIDWDKQLFKNIIMDDIIIKITGI